MAWHFLFLITSLFRYISVINALYTMINLLINQLQIRNTAPYMTLQIYLFCILLRVWFSTQDLFWLDSSRRCIPKHWLRMQKSILTSYQSTLIHPVIPQEYCTTNVLFIDSFTWYILDQHLVNAILFILFFFSNTMAFPNYSYGMASMGYPHGPTNHGKIGSYPMNGLGLGGSGMDMIHPAMNPYPPGES